ncbi:hypothetical protein GW17_00044285 [Ensete ventricosum]|nr:hypothetical protein GW17_00044285 [Ensete ventricosum]
MQVHMQPRFSLPSGKARTARYVPVRQLTGTRTDRQGLQFRYLPSDTSGTYRSARLPVCGPPATGQFRQKSTVDGRLKGEINRRRSIEGEIDRRRSIEREKGRKKKRKKKKKKEKRRKKTYRPHAVLTRAPSPLAGRQRPRVASACESRALFLPIREKDRDDSNLGYKQGSPYRSVPAYQDFLGMV